MRTALLHYKEKLQAFEGFLKVQWWFLSFFKCKLHELERFLS